MEEGFVKESCIKGKSSGVMDGESCDDEAGR